MADAKISALTELAVAPADDDELVIVDKSDMTQAASGTTKRITVANLTPTYPTFAWNQYYNTAEAAAITVPGNDQVLLPLDTTGGALVTNPAGWAINDGINNLPNGVYAITWYWEQSGTGTFFDNYAYIRGSVLGEIIYPTAPMSQPDSYYGSMSSVMKLVAENTTTNYIQFTVVNIDASPHDIFNLVTVTRLDA
jgi:hypothetical protein